MVYYLSQGYLKEKKHDKHGLKAKSLTAQSNAMGTVDLLSCALKVQKEGHQLKTIYAKNA